MTNEYAMERNDIPKIEKLNNLNKLSTFYADVTKLVKNVKTDHTINRWQCLADVRFEELKKETYSRYNSLYGYLINEVGSSTMDLILNWIIDAGKLPTYDMSSDTIEIATELKRLYKELKSAGILG